VKILMTGGTGFLGGSLAESLRAKGHDVTALGSKDAQLTDPGSLDRFDAKYDRIYHLAAWTQAGDFCLKHPGEQWVINQALNTTVLSYWQRKQPQAKMIAMGSSCCYAGHDFRESAFMEGEPTPSLYTYAMTKRMLYQGLRALRAQYGLKYLCAVPSTLYGPDYHTDGRQMHFIFDLIRKIIRGQELGEEVVLWGDGLQKRELIFRDDFVALLDVAVEKAGDEALLNIGSGEEHSIRDFAAEICALVGYPAEKIKYDAAKYVGVTSKCLRVEKLRALAPGYTLTPLREGLKKTIDWFHAAKAWQRGSGR
jgi:GDP-L-fucose synthase